MEYNILVASVGGQGGVTLARIISQAAMLQGLNVRVGETLGMAQRGGAVQSHIRIGDSVHGFVIPHGRANVLLSLEPSESVRAPEYIGPETKVLMNTSFIHPIQTLLGNQKIVDLNSITTILKELSPQIITIDAKKITLSVEAPNSLNIVILGAYAALNDGVLTEWSLRESMFNLIPKRFHKENIRAYESGYEEILNII